MYKKNCSYSDIHWENVESILPFKLGEELDVKQKFTCDNLTGLLDHIQFMCQCSNDASSRSEAQVCICFFFVFGLHEFFSFSSVFLF